MSFLTSKNFWVATIERVVKTFFQATIALKVGDNGLGLLNVDWGKTFSVAGLAAFISLATCIISAKPGKNNSPSATNES